MVMVMVIVMMIMQVSPTRCRTAAAAGLQVRKFKGGGRVFGIRGTKLLQRSSSSFPPVHLQPAHHSTSPLHLTTPPPLPCRMGCERVDVEARMCSSTRAALQRWIRAHFNALQMQPFISAIVSSIHITDPLLPLHDPHICKRSLASAAACSPPPHALKFAATCTDAVACARMQQQAQEAQRGFNMPVCCVAMGDGGGGGVTAAVPSAGCCAPPSPSASLSPMRHLPQLKVNTIL